MRAPPTENASRFWRKRSPHFAITPPIFKKKSRTCGNNSPSSKSNSSKRTRADENERNLQEYLARPERLELPTLWFEARCSIQLSYGRYHALYLLKGGRNRGARGGKNRGHLGLRKGNEASHDVGVELCAAGFDEPAYRFFVRETDAIGTRGNHSVESINYGDDTRNDGNLRLL